MKLSQYNLKNIAAEGSDLPAAHLFELPEKVLQFGTGVLLRGLPDYFIDKANKQGLFNGRIVVVKSTSQGDTSAFDKQDGLYTICVRGVEEGKKVEKNSINASISRVLTATEQWEEVLACAHNADMQIIVSNTTEVGIQLLNEDIRHHPPKSFPGKLLAFLYERYRAFEGSAHSGMVIVPTELIPDNGKKLESIVLELAHLNALEDSFIEWVENHNRFCNSLVDRIVPGKPEPGFNAEVQEALGFEDQLLIVAEVYRLWAIEGDDHVRSVLSFAGADAGVVITPNINQFRELKLRMLNGTHTLSCGLAFLAGCNTVQEAMEEESVAAFIEGLMQEEIAPAIPADVDRDEAHAFGNKVLDRFRNPHIRHQWLSITMNYSSKMKMRCIPLLIKHYELHTHPPQRFALGFAAFLLFMKGVEQREGSFFGVWNDQSYPIQDEQAPLFYRRWAGLSTAALVTQTLGDAAFWGTDLNALPGFGELVLENLNLLLNGGIKEAMERSKIKNVVAA